MSGDEAAKASQSYILPVTALEPYYSLSGAFILAGSGTALQVLEVKNARVCSTIKVFDTQSIHGISHWKSRNTQREGPSTTYLVWGGRSFRVIELISSESDNSVHIKRLSRETFVNDWILDSHCLSRREGSHGSSWKALILSSHNFVYHLYFQNSSKEGLIGTTRIQKIAVGPTCVLYSANMATVDGKTIFIASGTVFGEVLLWTFCLPSLSDSSSVLIGHLLQRYHGHEGSIFGVKMLSIPNKSLLQSPFPFWIASCSDDRTIRIWNMPRKSVLDGKRDLVNGNKTIAEAGFGSNKCDFHDRGASVATAMGHSSRIWSLTPFPTLGSSLCVLTSGEDGTTQVWQIKSNSYSEGMGLQKFHLQYIATKAYHTGKNIWATALVYSEEFPEPKVMTGGADGRIVLFDVDTRWLQKSFDNLRVAPRDVWQSNAINPSIYNSKPRSPTRSLFQSMQGEWNLFRTIKSKLPTYPSGIFRGTAEITPKETSNKAYDLEYLYEEEGSLTTEQGLSLRGTRRYVYRYKEGTDTISAWFVKPETKSVVDYLFHEVKFNNKQGRHEGGLPGNRGRSLKAQGHHLCIDDDYDAEYEFMSKAEELDTWSIKYQVVGPKKDYTLSANYTRLSKAPASGFADKQVSQGPSEREGSWPKYGLEEQDTVNSSLKAYCWLNGTHLLATTNTGYVVRATLTQNRQSDTDSGLLTDLTWEYIMHSPDLSSQSFLIGIEILNAALLTGRSGAVYSMSGTRKSFDKITSLPSQISNLFTENRQQSSTYSDFSIDSQTIGVVATCLDSTSTFVFRVRLIKQNETDVLAASSVSKLALPTNTIITSACWLKKPSMKTLILGSRSGALYIYADTQPSESEIQNPPIPIHRVHIEDSITIIQVLPTVNDDINHFLLTAGRDGRYAVHRLLLQVDEKDQVIGVETIHENEPPFGPNIEGAMFDMITKDLILWGFKGRHFVVWNEAKERELMEIDCGGAHRNWAYHREHNSCEGGKLIWTKASACHMLIYSDPSHRVLRAGTHGREIKALAVRPYYVPSEGGHLIATGAEDTIIRITQYTQSKDKPLEPFEHLGLIRKHRTGIQQLHWSPCGQYLFSAGGYEELYVWHVQSIPGFGIGITQKCQCPSVSDSCDLRITDFDIHLERQTVNGKEECFVIGAVYSDSSVRV